MGKASFYPPIPRGCSLQGWWPCGCRVQVSRGSLALPSVHASTQSPWFRQRCLSSDGALFLPSFPPSLPAPPQGRQLGWLPKITCILCRAVAATKESLLRRCWWWLGDLRGNLLLVGHFPQRDGFFLLWDYGAMQGESVQTATPGHPTSVSRQHPASQRDHY